MALTNKLSAIGDAIREKTGKTDLMTLDEMPVEIASITTGGGGGDLPEEAFNFTGDCSYVFANDAWTWFIDMYGNKITTKDITKAERMFNFCETLENIPFEIVFKPTTSYHVAMNLCTNCEKIKQPPKLKNFRPQKISGMFQNCYSIREYPENYGADWDWGHIENTTNQYDGDTSSLVASNYSLRKLPIELFYKHHNSYSGYFYSMYYQFCSNCFVLDEAVNIPVPYTNTTWTNNALFRTVSDASRLKNFTFATNDDGTPIAIKWKSQTLDFSSNTGYTSYARNILNHNSGITADKEVKDDATYQALKNDPDWFATKIEYSRYNHDSAVATINSLPDTSAYLASAGGTNTIKFRRQSGELTDGGAIGNLTAEEIAVATAKGWTVTFAN